VRIAGIAGSLRAGSHNLALLRAAAGLLPPGVELVTYEGLGELPPFSEDLEAPASVERLRAFIASAEALLVATPEYNGSIPGVLKNALDWASRPYPDNSVRGLPTAVTGASTGLFGAVWAQADARRVLARMGARVVDEELPIGQAADAFTPDGELADPELAEALRALLEQLVEAGREPLAAAA